MNLVELCGPACMQISSSVWRYLKFRTIEDNFLVKGSFIDIQKFVAINFCYKNKQALSQINN